MEIAGRATFIAEHHSREVVEVPRTCLNRCRTTEHDGICGLRESACDLICVSRLIAEAVGFVDDDENVSGGGRASSPWQSYGASQSNKLTEMLGGRRRSVPRVERHEPNDCREFQTLHRSGLGVHASI